MIRVETETGLAYWASYLINGDASGISDEDRADADAFAAYCEGSIVSLVDDSEHIGRVHIPGVKASGLQADCVDYVIHYHDASPPNWDPSKHPIGTRGPRMPRAKGGQG